MNKWVCQKRMKNISSDMNSSIEIHTTESMSASLAGRFVNVCNEHSFHYNLYCHRHLFVRSNTRDSGPWECSLLMILAQWRKTANVAANQHLHIYFALFSNWALLFRVAISNSWNQIAIKIKMCLIFLTNNRNHNQPTNTHHIFISFPEMIILWHDKVWAMWKKPFVFWNERHENWI